MVQRAEDEPRFPDADRFEYYGYKFEQLCSAAPTPAPAAPHNPGPGPEPVVDATSEFSALVRLGLGKHRILMAAEVDCSTSDQAAEEVQLERLRELKTFK
ncbi:RAI1 domain-containing protein, partial [Haematococcus lacustris]